jgi:hypothetical protein
MFQALLVNPQEALHKLQLAYCLRVVSVGFTKVKFSTLNSGEIN